jgi:hypothetical protein
LLFPWFASPFGPGLWIAAEPFARILLTASQMVRGRGVLVRRATGEFEFGTYLDDTHAVQLSDTQLALAPEDDLEWGWFGKRRLGLTWEHGTDFHRMIRDTDNTRADGGESDAISVDIGTAHRMLKGTNNADVISRVEENAEAEYGGDNTTLSGIVMALLVGLMLVLGSLTGIIMM